MQAYSVGFSSNPAIASPDGDATRTEAMSFVLSPRNALPQTMQFLTLYPTNFTVLDEMLAVLQSLAGRKPTPPNFALFALSDKPEGNLY
ncbi:MULTISPECIES: hypothetical protein [Nostocaceae]|uniref:hypothetical protein n=1 Tax=Nostocaceae TaxID=1162 RepID=UPI0016856609|nr:MULTISPECIES: hypothetical protein [Nostocaceae]MBD2478443.1 hypothetical protein [Anabaena sp. FACHB-83]